MKFYGAYRLWECGLASIEHDDLKGAKIRCATLLDLPTYLLSQCLTCPLEGIQSFVFHLKTPSAMLTVECANSIRS